jgi:hypothetical protein
MDIKFTPIAPVAEPEKGGIVDWLTDLKAETALIDDVVKRIHGVDQHVALRALNVVVSKLAQEIRKEQKMT